MFVLVKEARKKREGGRVMRKHGDRGKGRRGWGRREGREGGGVRRECRGKRRGTMRGGGVGGGDSEKRESEM